MPKEVRYLDYNTILNIKRNWSLIYYSKFEDIRDNLFETYYLEEPDTGKIFRLECINGNVDNHISESFIKNRHEIVKGSL